METEIFLLQSFFLSHFLMKKKVFLETSLGAAECRSCFCFFLIQLIFSQMIFSLSEIWTLTWMNHLTLT